MNWSVSKVHRLKHSWLYGAIPGCVSVMVLAVFKWRSLVVINLVYPIGLVAVAFPLLDEFREFLQYHKGLRSQAKLGDQEKIQRPLTAPELMVTDGPSVHEAEERPPWQAGSVTVCEHSTAAATVREASNQDKQRHWFAVNRWPFPISRLIDLLNNGASESL